MGAVGSNKGVLIDVATLDVTGTSPTMPGPAQEDDGDEVTGLIAAVAAPGDGLTVFVINWPAGGVCSSSAGERSCLVQYELRTSVGDRALIPKGLAARRPCGDTDRWPPCGDTDRASRGYDLRLALRPRCAGGDVDIGPRA